MSNALKYLYVYSRVSSVSEPESNKTFVVVWHKVKKYKLENEKEKMNKSIVNRKCNNQQCLKTIMRCRLFV